VKDEDPHGGWSTAPETVRQALDAARKRLESRL